MSPDVIIICLISDESFDTRPAVEWPVRIDAEGVGHATPVAYGALVDVVASLTLSV